MRTRARLALLALAWLALGAQAPRAPAPPPVAPAPFRYYRWIDANGVVNYTQTPPPEGVPETPRPPEPGAPPARARVESPGPPPEPTGTPWDRATDAGLEAFVARRYAEAAVHLREALREAQRLPPGDPRLGLTLDHLSAAYLADRKFALAEPLLRRWLAGAEAALGGEHPLVGEITMRLGVALTGQKKHAPAEPWLRRALAIAEQSAGPDHPQTVGRAILLARVLTARKRWAEAEPLHLRVVASLERVDPEGALPGALVALARFYEAARPAEAEGPYRRALAMLEVDLGPDHPDLAPALEGLARTLRATGRAGEAAPLETRARALRGLPRP
jgi:tetratricopeptide (TPR) repeat protein